MECTVKWAGEAKFIAETGSGHAVLMEGAEDLGGKNQAPRPMEMILLGAGGCTAYDVVLILKRGRLAIEGCEVKITAERAEVDPKVFTKIHYHYTVTGRNLKPEKVEHAINLSAKKYCSASIMLEKTAKITHDFSIVDLAAAA